jgi:lysophospholipase L1-like esterase
MFKELGIRYLFCDAFDVMINKNIYELVDKTHLIDGDRYWGYRNKTMANLLIDTNRKDVWEDNTNWKNTTAGKHPSSNGYKLIANELYKFINEGNLLVYNKSKNSHLL